MPVDRTQPVYPPSKGEDILATWGDAVSDHVVQRFVSAADRDLKWANPPKGAMCITLDQMIEWVYDGTNWRLRHGGAVSGTLSAVTPIFTGGTAPIFNFSKSPGTAAVKGGPINNRVRFTHGGLWLMTASFMSWSNVNGSWGLVGWQLFRNNVNVWNISGLLSYNPTAASDRQSVTMTVMLGLEPGDEMHPFGVLGAGSINLDANYPPMGGANFTQVTFREIPGTARASEAL